MDELQQQIENVEEEITGTERSKSEALLDNHERQADAL